MCTCAVLTFRRQFRTTSINLWFMAPLTCKKKKKNLSFFCLYGSDRSLNWHSSVQGSRRAITPSPTKSEVTGGCKTANMESLYPLWTQSQALKAGMRSCGDIDEPAPQSHAELQIIWEWALSFLFTSLKGRTKTQIQQSPHSDTLCYSEIMVCISGWTALPERIHTYIHTFSESQFWCHVGQLEPIPAHLG